SGGSTDANNGKWLIHRLPQQGSRGNTCACGGRIAPRLRQGPANSKSLCRLCDVPGGWFGRRPKLRRRLSSQLIAPIALLLLAPRASPDTSSAMPRRFGAQQKPLRSIDRVSCRFDLIAKLRNLATGGRDQRQRLGHEVAMLGVHGTRSRGSSGVTTLVSSMVGGHNTVSAIGSPEHLGRFRRTNYNGRRGNLVPSPLGRMAARHFT